MAIMQVSIFWNVDLKQSTSISKGWIFTSKSIQWGETAHFEVFTRETDFETGEIVTHGIHTGLLHFSKFKPSYGGDSWNYIMSGTDYEIIKTGLRKFISSLEKRSFNIIDFAKKVQGERLLGPWSVNVYSTTPGDDYSSGSCVEEKPGLYHKELVDMTIQGT